MMVTQNFAIKTLLPFAGNRTRAGSVQKQKPSIVASSDFWQWSLRSSSSSPLPYFPRPAQSHLSTRLFIPNPTTCPLPTSATGWSILSSVNYNHNQRNNLKGMFRSSKEIEYTNSQSGGGAGRRNSYSFLNYVITKHSDIQHYCTLYSKINFRDR